MTKQKEENRERKYIFFFLLGGSAVTWARWLSSLLLIQTFFVKSSAGYLPAVMIFWMKTKHNKKKRNDFYNHPGSSSQKNLWNKVKALLQTFFHCLLNHHQVDNKNYKFSRYLKKNERCSCQEDKKEKERNNGRNSWSDEISRSVMRQERGRAQRGHTKRISFVLHPPSHMHVYFKDI